MPQDFSKKAIDFYLNLSKPSNLPKGIEVINPYESPAVKNIVKKFFNKFYSDNEKRRFIFGINPGRFGAGTTGIGFTDPMALREFCGIENDLGTKRELSSQFIYEMINAYGNIKDFCYKFFITALYPLAIIKDGKNYNYYDEKIIYQVLKNQMKELIKQQIEFGAERETAVCLGKRNLIFLNEINKEEKFFNKILLLEHPRYIMQYKRKKLNEYLDKYHLILHEP